MADTEAGGTGTLDVQSFSVQDKILQSLDVIIPANRVPTGYGVALAALALTLVLLTAGFIALAAFMGWLVVWHILGAFISLPQGPYFIFHIPMALLGLFLFIFLVKPMFFGQKTEEDRIISLCADDAPLLFAFVHKLCAVVGAARPAVIEVDCDANASASFRRGLRGVIGKQMILRIGLPLIAAMPLRQLAGILAHELGHFNQRQGMIWSYLIRRINYFFARIVFERDRLDQRLARWREKRRNVGYLFYLLMAALVESMRGVLWLMLTVGELLSCHVLRRMEYDADSMEAHIGGADEFASASVTLALMQIAVHQARQDLVEAHETKRLPDDLPRMIVSRLEGLATHREEILQSLTGRKTRLLDTHPCHADRILNVQRLGAAGVLRGDWPATVLFANFEALCRRASEAFYRSVLGKTFSEVKLVTAAELAAQQAGLRDSVKQVRNYLQDQIVPSRPVFPLATARTAPPDVDSAARELQAARDLMLSLAAKMGPAAEDHERASASFAVASAGMDLARLAPAQVARRIERRAEKDRSKAQSTLEESEKFLLPFEAAASQRLTLALQLLNSPAVIQRLADQTIAPADLALWLDLCEILRVVQVHLLAARERAIRAHVLFGSFVPEDPYPPLEKKILLMLAEATQALREAMNALGDRPYPFEHGKTGITCADYLVPAWPDQHDIGAVAEAAMNAMDNFTQLSYSVIAKLVACAQQVESALGLPALPEVDDKQRREDTRKQIQAQQKKEERSYWLWFGLRAVAGTLLLGLLIWKSIDPPNLPAMPWENGRPGNLAYRPASLSWNGSMQRVSFNYQPSPPPGQPNWYRPGNPGFYQPGQPGHQAGMPTYWNSAYGQYYSPNIPTGPHQPMIPGQHNIPGQPGYTARPGHLQHMPGQPNQFGQPTYQPPPIYQPPAYQPNGGYQPSGGYNQHGGYQPPGSYQPQGGYQPRQPSGGSHQPGGGYRPPSPGGGGGGAGGGGRPGR